MSTITGARHIAFGSDDPNIPALGPFIDGNDNLYVIAETSATANDLGLFKSTDDGGTWSEIDTSNRPSIANNLAAWSVFQVGTVLHIATLSAAYASGMDVTWDIFYHTVNTSDAGSNPDTWQITNETVVSPVGEAQGAGAMCDIAVRSDGDVIIVHQGSDAAIMGSDFDRVAYSRRESASWTTDVAIHASGSEEQSQFSVNCVLGTNDNIHIFWIDIAAGVNDVHAKTLDSGNSLSTRIVVHDDGWSYTYRPRPITYDRSGTQYVMVLFGDQSSLDYYSRELEEDGGDDISTNAAVQTLTSNNTSTPNLGLVQDLDSADVWGTYLEVTTLDLQSMEKAGAAAWGSDTERQTGHIRSSWWQAYTRDAGKHLGYVYCDHDGSPTTALYFAEITTAAGGTAVTTLAETDALVPIAVEQTSVSVGTLAEVNALVSVTAEQSFHLDGFQGVHVNRGQHENPVHQIGSNLYTINYSNGSTFRDLKVFKSTNNGETWSEVAEITDIPTAGGVVLRSLATKEDSDDIHVVTEAADGQILYHLFDPGTDAFTITKEVVSAATVGSTNHHTSLAIRSDGSVVCFYRTTSSPFVMRFRVRNGSWGSETNISADDGTDAIDSGTVVLGSSDRVHFFWHNHTDGTIYHRCLNSSDVLQTEQLVTSPGAITDMDTNFSGRYAKSGGAVRVGYGYESSDKKWGVIHADSADAPSWTVDTDLPDAQVPDDNLVLDRHLSGLVGNDTDEEFLLGFIQGSDRSVEYVRRPDGGSWSIDTDTLKEALQLDLTRTALAYGDFGLRVTGGIAFLNWWSKGLGDDWLYQEVGLGQEIGVGTLAEVEALVPVGVTIYKTIGTIAETNSLVSVGIIQPTGQTINVGTLSEVEALVAIPGAKVVGVGTLAELEALQPITVLRKVDIGTLTETDTLIAVGLDLDGSTDLFIAIDLTDALALAQVQAAQGLGTPTVGDHVAKIYHPDRLIVRR